MAQTQQPVKNKSAAACEYKCRTRSTRRRRIWARRAWFNSENSSVQHKIWFDFLSKKKKVKQKNVSHHSAALMIQISELWLFWLNANEVYRKAT